MGKAGSACRGLQRRVVHGKGRTCARVGRRCGSRGSRELGQAFLGGFQHRRLAELAARAEPGDKLGFAGHGVALKALQRIALEEDRQLARLRLDALALDGEDVVPPVGVKQAGEQRRAQQLAHLVAR